MTTQDWKTLATELITLLNLQSPPRAIPARRLGEVVNLLHSTTAADNAVAAYASQDAARFGR